MPEPDEPVRPDAVQRYGAPPAPATTPIQIGGAPQPPGRRPSTALIVLGAAAAVVILTVVALVVWNATKSSPKAAPAAAPEITINGTLTLTDLDPGVTNRDPGLCAGRSGYDDITEGTNVTVRDQAGAVIGVGRLGVGTPQGVQKVGAYNIAARCVYTFQVYNVPDRPFYGIEVSHRGSVNYSRAQVSSLVQLSLGS